VEISQRYEIGLAGDMGKLIVSALKLVAECLGKP
jgi:hypothetical protein